MAIAAQKFIQTVFIRLKGQLGDGCAAFGALPLALVGLPLETSSAIVIKIHFTKNLTTFSG